MLSSRIKEFQGVIYFKNTNEINALYITIIEEFVKLVDGSYLNDQTVQKGKLAVLEQAQLAMEKQDFILMSDVIQLYMLPLVKGIEENG